jgi:hypothetical protein
MRQIFRSDRRRPGLFAARQVYVRSGPASQYVTLSRPLQIGVAVGLGMLVLWLGLASYAALSEHLETRAQARELARLESITKALQTSFEQEGRKHPGPDAAPLDDADLITEVAELKASRERAMMLADAAAGEADALRREVALAYERIRGLELDLVRTSLDEAADSLVGNRSADLPVIGNLLEPISCPSVAAEAAATCR